ncbi:hypothetical protein HHK36_002560 [Tetracentron sinense]|uniref:Cyclin-dependent kinase inhibitor n=1 Tax=Tetracentron sinense TaxID=13715 RepID=A0A834ZQI9_TETSI|nr:hypothetical protein HHK36_002560 [Tetracentron sinense]
MEVAQVGARTRARPLAMAAGSAGTAKRRKIGSGELKLSASYLQLRSRSQLVITPEKPISPETSENSGRVITDDRCSSPSSDLVPASRCSSNGSNELLKDSLRSVDPEGDDFEIESSTRETTPSSDIRTELDELEFMARPSEAEKMPSEEEIAEFFSAAEKDEQKRFAEKYNYDFEKDVPLEGRYAWVRLKP